jgi:hypothetical protein
MIFAPFLKNYKNYTIKIIDFKEFFEADLDISQWKKL